MVVTSDYTVALLQHPGSYLWNRQEALASVLSTEIVDLPVSEKDAAIEKEFGDKECKLSPAHYVGCTREGRIDNRATLQLGAASSSDVNELRVKRRNKSFILQNV